MINIEDIKEIRVLKNLRKKYKAEGLSTYDITEVIKRRQFNRAFVLAATGLVRVLLPTSTNKFLPVQKKEVE